MGTAVTLRERLDPGRTALLVIDMQNDFCAEGGYLQGRRGYDVSYAAGIADMVGQAVEAARRAGMPVAWLRSIYDFKYLNPAEIAKRGEEGCCMEGSWGADFFRLCPAPGEIVVDKHSYSGFHGTSLDRRLRGRGIDTILACGVATNVCVDSTIRDGFFHGYHIVLLEDCVGSASRAGHEGTLTTVRNNIGTVIPLRAMQEALGQGAPAVAGAA